MKVLKFIFGIIFAIILLIVSMIVGLIVGVFMGFAAWNIGMDRLNDIMKARSHG
jgi:ABC-type microcin C transport system permease subunit YejE